MSAAEARSRSAHKDGALLEREAWCSGRNPKRVLSNEAAREMTQEPSRNSEGEDPSW